MAAFCLASQGEKLKSFSGGLGLSVSPAVETRVTGLSEQPRPREEEALSTLWDTLPTHRHTTAWLAQRHHAMGKKKQNTYLDVGLLQLKHPGPPLENERPFDNCSKDFHFWQHNRLIESPHPTPHRKRYAG